MCRVSAAKAWVRWLRIPAGFTNSCKLYVSLLYFEPGGFPDLYHNLIKPFRRDITDGSTSGTNQVVVGCIDHIVVICVRTGDVQAINSTLLLKDM
jgi:hypothetical protein